ncbi:hypothetical protein J1614_005254 [Plenodomus biglobosus]|nr:hypothetical protein J1614_005254 [Plenodomus biglobosus]
MSYGGNSNSPRGDPLAGWKKENLAAPKVAAQEDYGYQATVYEDRPPTSVQGPNAASLPPALSDPRAGLQGHNRTTPQHDHVSAHSYQETVSGEHPPMKDHQNVQDPVSPPLPQAATSKRMVDEEKAACPHGDTRWPPPKTSHSKPLQLLLNDKGSQRIYYHLIHKNLAPDSKFWKKEIQSKAQSFFARKFAPEERSDTSDKSSQELQDVKEQADFEEKGRLRNAIITAQLQKKMRVVSTGPRGTIWLLEEESVETWRCIEVLQKGDPNKAVSIGAVSERFEIFGVGLKGEKDHVLLLGQKVNR